MTAAEAEDEEINVIIDKAKKKSTKKKTKSKVEKKVEVQENGNADDASQKISEENEENENCKKQILGVFVHYADCLKLDFFVLHPVVKVSLVNLATGKLIAKSDKNRKVTSYYEGEHVSHIVQLMTQAHNHPCPP